MPSSLLDSESISKRSEAGAVFLRWDEGHYRPVLREIPHDLFLFSVTAFASECTSPSMHTMGVLMPDNNVSDKNVSSVKVAQMGPLFDPPCQFCKYEGADYWEAETHDPECPWYRIAGSRARLLVVYAVSAAVQNNAKSAEAKLRDEHAQWEREGRSVDWPMGT